jgi:hypothetical protein
MDSAHAASVLNIMPALRAAFTTAVAVVIRVDITKRATLVQLVLNSSRIRIAAVAFRR